LPVTTSSAVLPPSGAEVGRLGRDPATCAAHTTCVVAARRGAREVVLVERCKAERLHTERRADLSALCQPRARLALNPGERVFRERDKKCGSWRARDAGRRDGNSGREENEANR